MNDTTTITSTTSTTTPTPYDYVALHAQISQILTNSPKVNLHTSPESISRVSSLTAKVMLPNPVWALMFPCDPSQRLQTYTDVVTAHISGSVAKGGFILEINDYEVFAGWSSPGSHVEPVGRADEQTAGEEHEEKDDLERVDELSEKIKKELIWDVYGQDHWTLEIVCRVPYGDRSDLVEAKPDTGVSVSAVLRPVMELAMQRGEAMWLSTTNQHAIDMYEHYGWTVVLEEVVAGRRCAAMVLRPGAYKRKVVNEGVIGQGS